MSYGVPRKSLTAIEDLANTPPQVEVSTDLCEALSAEYEGTQSFAVPV
jgi:hypothetical protein